MNRYAGGRLAAYLAIVLIGGLGLWRVESTVHRLDDLVHDQAAQRCVNAWETRDQIRDAIAVGSDAIIEAAEDADPERVAAYRAILAERIAAAYPDPSCSLEAARAVLDQ